MEAADTSGSEWNNSPTYPPPSPVLVSPFQVLQLLRHPNIIHMEDVFESDTKIHMVMEIMQGGELFDYVVEKGTLSESEASVMVRKVRSP